MEPAKPSLFFKIEPYDITLATFSNQSFSLSVIDHQRKCEFVNLSITLKQIVVNTIIKAFEKENPQITYLFTHAKETNSLQITINVDSPFLKPLEEIFSLCKLRDISDSALMSTAVASLFKKMNSMGLQRNPSMPCSVIAEARRFQDANTVPVGSIKLKKGKYLLTVSCFVKAHNQWVYLYCKGTPMWTHGGSYLPVTDKFMPLLARKVIDVTPEEELVELQTTASSSYSITLSNFIVTGRKF